MFSSPPGGSPDSSGNVVRWMGGKVRCYYDGQRVLLETDDSNNDKRYFVFGNYIDEVLMMNDVYENNDCYYGHDHLYSVVVIYDDDYDVYG